MELTWKLTLWSINVIKSCETPTQLNNFYRLISKKFLLTPLGVITINGRESEIKDAYQKKLMEIYHDQKLVEDIKKRLNK